MCDQVGPHIVHPSPIVNQMAYLSTHIQTQISHYASWLLNGYLLVSIVVHTCKDSDIDVVALSSYKQQGDKVPTVRGGGLSTYTTYSDV